MTPALNENAKPVNGEGNTTATDPVTSYARDVVAGRIVTGQLVKLACQRHLNDLETASARGLRFDLSEALAAIDFWEICPHLKGRAAKRGETLKLEGWQRFIIGSVYGWKRADGSRRFRVAWVEVARKNGKSTLLYPAGLFALALDGEEGAEVYSVATKRDQARLVFDLAKRAVTRNPDLAEMIQPFAFSLTCAESFGKFEAVSSDADTLDGLNPSAALCDEIHKWPHRSLWDVIETGMGAREQPLMWAITTAGEDGGEDVYGQEHDYTVQVLEGVVQDDARFGYIACIDPEDDWTDPKVVVKANPNLGVSVFAPEIAAQVERGKRIPAFANEVKRLRLGRRTQDGEAAIPLNLWDAARELKLTRDALKGLPCWSALDLANTSDFAALCHLFPLTEDLEPAPEPERPGVWAYIWRLWIPEETENPIGIRLREIAEPWIADGWVQVTAGTGVDPTAIEADVIADTQFFDLRGLAFDPFNAQTVANRFALEGIQVFQFPQRLSSFSEPTKLFLDDLAAGRTRHNGNAAARWMARNVVLNGNGAGHRMPSRKRSSQKIDGIVAAIMARGLAAVKGGESGGRFYETNGVEVV
ncbi:Phage Terminase [Gemmata sp. SH-PL17]|uniref:terminase large subunit n=1 Tax=Gemmata sp. SH-PL17 TaxID=1630693 RepID=UPI00078E34C4|nr:terminase large subunit [Gemmata sp. SH-PL17]AMV23433.1 Phage Terminase [Gemmata sp. SH-PL17]